MVEVAGAVCDQKSGEDNLLIKRRKNLWLNMKEGWTQTLSLTKIVHLLAVLTHVCFVKLNPRSAKPEMDSGCGFTFQFAACLALG